MAITRMIDKENLRVVITAPNKAEFKLLKELIYSLDEELEEIQKMETYVKTTIQFMRALEEAYPGDTIFFIKK